MKGHKVTQKDILYLTASLFFIVIVWVASNIYHAAVTSQISENLQMQIIPIEATFDTETIQKLKTRREISPNFETTTPTQASPPAAIIPTAEPITTITPTEGPLPTEAILPTETPLPTEEPTIAP